MKLVSYILIICFLLIGLTFVSKATAEPWIVATINSYHFDREKGYEENNWGVGVEENVTDTIKAHVGVYRNSFARHSAYVLGSYSPIKYGRWSVGLAIGPATGYIHSVDVIGGGVVMKEWKHVGFNILIHPAAIALQVKGRF